MFICSHKRILTSENFNAHQLGTDLETGYYCYSPLLISFHRNKNSSRYEQEHKESRKILEMCTSAMHPGHHIRSFDVHSLMLITDKKLKGDRAHVCYEIKEKKNLNIISTVELGH